LNLTRIVVVWYTMDRRSEVENLPTIHLVARRSKEMPDVREPGLTPRMKPPLVLGVLLL